MQKIQGYAGLGQVTSRTASCSESTVVVSDRTEPARHRLCGSRSNMQHITQVGMITTDESVQVPLKCFRVTLCILYAGQDRPHCSKLGSQMDHLQMDQLLTYLHTGLCWSFLSTGAVQFSWLCFRCFPLSGRIVSTLLIHFVKLCR